jgi:hypothetical protein
MRKLYNLNVNAASTLCHKMLNLFHGDNNSPSQQIYDAAEADNNRYVENISRISVTGNRTQVGALVRR